MQYLSRDLWIIAAGFMAALHIGKLPPAVPILQAELGISLLQAGLLLSMVQGAGMFFALILGSYTEKIGLKRCIVLGLSLLAIASCLGAYATSVHGLLLLRALEGCGFLIITLSAPAYLRQLVPAAQLQTKMGLWSAYMGGGMGIGLLLTPFLIPLFKWQGVWLSFALTSAILAVIIYYSVPAAARSVQPVHVKAIVKTTLSHPPVWWLAGIFACYSGQWLSLVGFLPTIYQQNQLSMQLAGMLTAFVAMSNAIGTLICGMLLQRGYLPRKLLQSSFCVLIGCALSFYVFKEQLPFWLQYGLVLSFSCFGGLIPATIFSQALHFAPQPTAIGATIGLALQGSACSQFIVPPMVAWIVSLTGSWIGVGFSMALLSCLGIVLSFKLFHSAPHSAQTLASEVRR